MRVIRKDGKIKVYAEKADGYYDYIVGKVVCVLKDNENGWDVTFPSYSSAHPTIRMNLDYDHVALLAKAFSKLNTGEKE